MEERKILCERCRGFFPFTEVRFVPRGENQKIALCVKCREKAKTEPEKTGKPDSNKQPFFCGRCRYKFKLDPSGHTNLKCPYCGKDDKIIPDKVPSTDKLLEMEE
jgi:uncharacterized CHY-type Zn-finger protein